MHSPDVDPAAWPESGLSLNFLVPRVFDARFVRLSVGALIGLVVGLGWKASHDAQHPATTLVIALGAVFAYAVIVALRFLRTDRKGPVARLYADRAELPVSERSRHRVSVAYRDVLSIGVRNPGDPNTRGLMIGTRDRVFVYPERSFATPGGGELLRRALLSRIAAQPDAQALIGEFDERVQIARATERRPALATRGLLASVFAGFLVEVLYMPDILVQDADVVGLLRLGANAPALVTAGQFFRLFSATFLHAGPLHLTMNSVALLSLGTVLERMLGPARVLLLFFTSAIGGSLGSTLAHVPLSVGASTAVFGLLGALGWINLRYWKELPLGPRQPLRWWLWILGLNALLPVIFPIDWAAHVGGLVTGLVVAQCLLFGKQLTRAIGPASPFVLRLARLGVLVFAVALVQAGLYALEHDRATVERQFLAAHPEWRRPDGAPESP